MRADLQKRIMAEVEQPPYSHREAHRRAEVLHPVGVVEGTLAQQVARHCGVHGYRCRSRLQPGEHVGQIGAQRVHLWAVGGHIDLHPTAESAALLQCGDEIA